MCLPIFMCIFIVCVFLYIFVWVFVSMGMGVLACNTQTVSILQPNVTCLF